MTERYLSQLHTGALVRFLHHSLQSHTDEGGTHVSIRMAPLQAQQLINTLNDFNNPFELSDRLGPMVHRAATEGEGLCDAVDVILDEMDPEERDELFDRAREYLGLPSSEALGLYRKVHSPNGAPDAQKGSLVTAGEVGQAIAQSLGGDPMSVLRSMAAKAFGIPEDQVFFTGGTVSPHGGDLPEEIRRIFR